MRLTLRRSAALTLTAALLAAGSLAGNLGPEPLAGKDRHGRRRAHVPVEDHR